ncbi:MAG TPA: hypothetical protein VLH79_03445 [Chthonomonadales bacterium]|nr:hypothetical protein [Chthonomonadales bacterium]
MTRPAEATTGTASVRRGAWRAPWAAWAAALLAALALSPSAALADGSVWDLLRRTSQNAPEVAPVAAVERTDRRPGGVLNNVSHSLRRLGAALNSDVRVQGQHSMGLHVETVSGSQTAYRDANHFGRRGLGGLYNNTDLTISGRIAGIVNFETRYSNRLHGSPHDNRLSLNYSSGPFSIDAGDIQGSIGGNTLVGFSRSLKGVQLAAEVMPGLRLTSLISNTRGQSRTITVNGANRSGPYFVYAGMVVEGSERVRVNDREMVKGEDYTLDPYTGELNFLKGLIVHEFDTIAVSFETFGFGQPAGLLTGWRADLSAIRGVNMGVTYLSQESRQRGLATRTRTEQFFGYNNPNAPYSLEFQVDVTLVRDGQGNVIGATPRHPMTVTAGGIPQVYGADFVVDPLLPNRVFFKLPIPSTQIVRITYVPATAGDNPGDRSVIGFDAGWQLGGLGMVTAELAQSRLDLAGQGVGGSAWQVRGDMKLAGDKVRWNWSLRDIQSRFTGIESAGFRRADRGLSMSLEYAPTAALRLNAGLERSRRPSFQYTGLTDGTAGAIAATSGTDDFGQRNLTASYSLGRAGQIIATHNTMSTRSFGGGRSDFTSGSLAYSGTLGRMSMDLSLGSTASRFRASALAGSTTDPATGGSDALNARLGMRWQPARIVSVTSNLATSLIRDQSGTRRDARDVSVGADLTPASNLRFSLNYLLQDSGGHSSVMTGGSGSGTGRSVDGAGPQPWWAARTAQGRSGSFFNPGSSISIGGAFGGGYNAGLGGSGNFSGGIHSPLAGGFSGASFGGRSRTLALAAHYQPLSSLALDLMWNSSSSIGDFLFNSNRNDYTANLSFSPGDNLQINTMFSRQRVTYVGTVGGTSSTMWFLNLRGRPVGKLTANLSTQLMVTDSSFQFDGSGSTGSGGLAMTDTGMNLSAWALRLEYPVWRTHAIYLELSDAASTGYLAGTQRQMQVGFDFDVTQNTRFTVGWRIQEFMSRGADPGAFGRNYRVRSLDADLNLRF